jgi:Ca2+-binding EF-hand superfamily protein
VLLKTGVDITRVELMELLIDFDHDGDAKLDIDEFVTLMTSSEDIAFC